MTLLCLSWKGRKRNLFTDIHKTLINNDKSMLAMLGMVIQSHLHFFCMSPKFHCVGNVLFRPRRAIQSHSKGHQWVFKSRAGVADPSQSNLYSDKVSYTIYVSSVVTQLNNTFKNLLQSCWLDLGPFHHSLLSSPFMHTKNVKFTFQSIHFSCKKETLFLYESKERHFVKGVQICFFLVYSEEIGKLAKAGPSLSASDRQQ